MAVVWHYILPRYQHVPTCYNFIRMSISVCLFQLGCQFTRKKRNQAVYFMSNRLRVKYRVIKRWNTSFKQIIYTLFKIYILLLRFFHQTKFFNVLENCFRKFRKRQLYFKSVTDILKMFMYERVRYLLLFLIIPTFLYSCQYGILSNSYLWFTQYFEPFNSCSFLFSSSYSL